MFFGPLVHVMILKNSSVCRPCWIALIGIALLVPFPIRSQSPQSSAPTNPQNFAGLPRIIKALQRRLDNARVMSNFPGAQVGFTFSDGQTPDGHPRYVSGSVVTGVADLQTNVPLKVGDRLLAGSIGKTLVSTLTLLLVQEGKLNLDDKIEKWLGREAWFEKLPNADSITLRMLLNHSSGIGDHAALESFQKQLFKSAARPIKYDELIAYVLNKKPLFPAGSGYSYGDTNYILAGMIIEAVTGRTLYELIAERILKPNKLERIIPSNSLTLPEVANGYIDNKPVIVSGQFTINPQWEWAAGGFASNAEDLARWCALLYSGAVLSPESMTQMFNSTTTGEGAGYGLGTMISRSKWGRSYGHDGEFPGYVSDMRYYTKYKLAITVLVNSSETPAVNRFLSSAAEDFAGLVIEGMLAPELSQVDQMKLQKLTEDWLRLIYAGKFDESWDQLSDSLKARYNKERWQQTMRWSLEGTGKLKTRTIKSIAYTNAEALNVRLDFDVALEKSNIRSETVTLQLQGREWRIASYSRN